MLSVSSYTAHCCCWTHCSLPMVANSLLSRENATATTSKSCSCSMQYQDAGHTHARCQHMCAIPSYILSDIALCKVQDQAKCATCHCVMQQAAWNTKQTFMKDWPVSLWDRLS